MLKDSRIDLWLLPLDQDLMQLEQLLSPDEVLRAERFHFPRHRRRFRNARALLRLILSRYLHCKAEDIRFAYNQYGKPEVHSQQLLQFNVSHTGDWGLVAVGKTHALGVDIEQYSARPYQGIAEHLFSAQEQETLQSINLGQKPWLFFNIWAQKEAFIKACGLGLFYPGNEFSVTSSAENQQRIFDKKNDTVWAMKTFMPKIALSAALCHRPEVSCIRYVELEHLACLIADQ